MPVEAADALQGEDVGFAGYTAGTMGQLPREPDVIAIPAGMVRCDPHVEGSPYGFAPRVSLRTPAEKAAAEGVWLASGAEVEYCLVQRAVEGRYDSFRTDQIGPAVRRSPTRRRRRSLSMSTREHDQR
ncbi:hypothetical protein IM697_24860 [Streptomyces ferrugineus]|uniref:Uncharacterized protein n=1 Tax=Streptomyces ferrugineus TaxID=1413221 RepID=A0A7M2SDF3_9ACTN|nr:hypothetical protein [Streptomyces ferrugineus]QOV33443.1 hypothetical protein IM697_24860 [Streptomyces ferrugineus]